LEEHSGNAMVRRQAGQIYRRLGMLSKAEAEEAIASSILGVEGVTDEDPGNVDPAPQSRPTLDAEQLADFLRQVNGLLDKRKEEDSSPDANEPRK
jgi:hypothetical protein